MEKCPCCYNQCENLVFKDNFMGLPLLKCNSCQHIKVSDAITSSEILKYYESQYSDERGSFFSNSYVQLMKKRAISQFEYISNFISLSNLSSVCDIGTGYGFLLSYFKSQGYENIYGLEFDDKCISYCQTQHLDVRKIFSEDDFTNLEKSNIIVMSHALEHFIDLNKTLNIMKDKCDYLFVEVPFYCEGIVQQWNDQEGHINFFNEKSLKLLFNNKNFNVLDVSRHGPNLNYYYNGWGISKYLRRKISGDWFFNKYNKNESGMWIRALLKTN
ncbi:class I SAM-dependent methyltransferase [Flavobacteriaceae bacterium]|nr:class I SAM-dependent methyltransferase [Flavobacteriaceae bacterium]